MQRDAHELLSLPSAPAGGTPRAAWIGGAVLSLAAAGFAGALIMRSVDSASPAAVPVAASPEAAAAPAPVEAPVAAAEPQVKAKAAAPAAKHANQPAAKPAPTVTAAPATPDRADPAPAPREVAADAGAPAPTAPPPAAVCATCGVVESVIAVTQKGEGSGAGAVAGGVLGGVLGHQVGGGKGKTAMTVLGAVGGAFAGHEVEKRTRSETLYNVHVRMDDGRTQVVQQSQSVAIGTHVVIEGSKLRVAGDSVKGG